MSSHASTAGAIAEGAPPHVHHMDPPTAYQSAKLGMWLFLATEILLFGGLFAAYALYHWWYFDQFHDASKHLDWRLGGLNTLVLIASSLTAALAVDAAQHNNNKKVVKLFGFSILCGAIFMVIKAIEYYGKAAHGLFPGTSHNGIAFGSPEFSHEYKMFYGLYYCMTGLHALHVLIGMGILTWALLLARKNRFSSAYYTPVELGALYWHLVDLIWIYLFPLLYLVG